METCGGTNKKDEEQQCQHVQGRVKLQTFVMPINFNLLKRKRPVASSPSPVSMQQLRQAIHVQRPLLR
jgi:hypothetical protein